MPSYTSHGTWTILGSSGQTGLGTKNAYPETFGVHVLPQQMSCKTLEQLAIEVSLKIEFVIVALQNPEDHPMKSSIGYIFFIRGKII